ncbi:hypothetical protein IFM89_023434 [Coptis chinensis]|uniref:AP2/ERF domain-containing protein n=1 Tax=Coptis chinensis TaxID=261450 RepID=A0A835J1N6_9MAGN|nr:hypothetical protein IFM89_023434 [Coptis chinensis]
MEMEMLKIKCEAMCGKHLLSMDDGVVRKCVKRRRREPIANLNVFDHKRGKKMQQQQLQQQQENIDQTTTNATSKRSSKFRGVSRHRWTGRFEAHLWDKGSWNTTQRKKGKQGNMNVNACFFWAYDEEESAARAYDLAALKYWGMATFTNFPVSSYEKEIETMQNLTKEEYLACLRRKSSGFSRGASKYRGVARHHHNGRWEARIGRVFGNKYLYLGTYKPSFFSAVTNFDSSQEKKHVFLKKDSVKKSSSSTALELLLRSSIFQELVEKNSSSSSEDETDWEDSREQQQASSDKQYNAIFYDRISDFPYVYSDGNSLLSEFDGSESPSYLFNQTEQFLWNGALNMSFVN